MIQQNMLWRNVNIKMKNTIFWNVDTQYDFMRDNGNYKGKLAIPNAETIEPNLAQLTKYAKKNNLVVVNTADWHTREDEELSEKPDFQRTFPQHCMRYTKGARFIPATNPENSYKIDWQQQTMNPTKLKESRNIVLYKNKFDVFAGNDFTNMVTKMLKPSKVVVYGVATNVCVDFAVKGLLERNIEVYVPTDAIKELPNLPLPLKEWEDLGAKLVTTKDVLEGRV